MGQSWSKMRKILEQDNICESLKGRIQYFATRYRKSHDEQGRVAIRIDGKEGFKSCFFDWQNKRVEAEKSVVIPNMEDMPWLEYWDRIHLETENFGGFDQYGFYEAFYYYQNHSIEESLVNESPIVRLFAILDKRVGKRRLEKIFPEIELQPAWLQVFYRLRIESEVKSPMQ